MKIEYENAYWELKKIINDPKSTDDEASFAEEVMNRFYGTFDEWKFRGSCVNKGEKSIKDGSKFVFHSSQLKPNYGNSEYDERDELLGTNHFGI